MIEIDLFPKELREKKKFKLNLKPVFKTKLVYTVLGSIVLLHLLLQIITMVNARRIRVLKRNCQSLSSQKAELGRLKAELVELNSKIPLIEQLIINRVAWSKKLNSISDLLVDGIWLEEISLGGEKTKANQQTLEYLIIRGSAASKAKDETALIGRFMQNLKDDTSFCGDFIDIELGPIKKRQIVQTEVMDFILFCRFDPEKVQSLLK